MKDPIIVIHHPEFDDVDLVLGGRPKPAPETVKQAEMVEKARIARIKKTGRDEK